MDLNAANQELMNLLRLKAPAVGVALLESNLPEGVERPAREQRFCFCVTLARLNGKVLGLTAEDLSCPFSSHNLGFFALPEGVTGSGKFGAHTADIIAEMPRLTRGRFKSVVVGPLDQMPVEPSVVLIVGNTAQTMRLVQAWLWGTGRRVEASLSGLAAVCSEAVAQVLDSGDCTVSVPCPGSRQFGRLAEDELLYAVPYRGLTTVVAGLEDSHGELTYPVPEPEQEK